MNGRRPYFTTPATDKDASKCQAWMYCYCEDAVYGGWARGECRKTCAEKKYDNNCQKIVGK